jgi:hypothetical protein
MRALALILAFTASAIAQYTIDWSTMDGGGGSGSAGGYTLEATVGQPDAFSGSTGTFALLGGYWAGIDEALPTLRIFFKAPNVILAWRNPSSGFTLQASPGLAPPNWLDVPIAPVLIGDEKQVIWGPPVNRHFFRLRRP